MTGQSTRPPTTLGSAPSMPAHTTTTSAAAQAVALPQQAVDAGHAHVGDQLRRAPIARAVTSASCATGRSLVPAVTT